MKNERIIKKGIFTFIVFAVCLVFVGALALNNTQKKVKADTIFYEYYFETYNIYPNQTQIVLYVFDAYYLTDNICTGSFYGYQDIDQRYEEYTFLFRQVEFLRYPDYDIQDFQAYIYNLQWQNLSGYVAPLFRLLSDGELGGQDFTITKDFVFPYYPYVESYYESGYDNGYDNGYDAGYIRGHEIGYDDGYGTGYDVGYDDGIEENIGTANWFVSSFEAVDSFLNIHIFPNITFGILLGIPFVIEVVWFIIRQFRGGGGD